MKLRVMLLAAFYLVCIPSIALAAFDVNSKEFKAVIGQLDMQGHADHEFSTCSIQQVYYDEVKEMLNDGKSGKDIIDYYVGQYGQAALREPNTKGSGMIAWGMPAFAFLAGAGVVAYGLKKLTNSNGQKVESTSMTNLSISDLEQSMINEAFEKERRKRF